MTEPDVPGLANALSVSSSNFQQCANGDDGGETCFYINGVLNDSKSLYRESDVIAERFVIPGLTIGHTYRLVYDYGWEKAVSPGHMNYDFVAGWNTTLGVLANPCGDPLGNPSADIRAVCDIATHTVKSDWSGANASFQVIPDAIFTTNAPLGLSAELGSAIDRFQTANGADAVRFDILGGSLPAGAFDNVTYTVSGDDVTARFTVRFIAGRTTVMLLWGGHFADSRDYRTALWDDDKNAGTPQHTGNLTGAAGQSGAPFHFTQQYLKNLNSGDSTGIGSLSNNVQGNVLEPLPKASITIAPSATNGIGESHTFTVTLMKDLDDGAGPIAAAGEHVDVTLTNGGGASFQLNAAASTCDNTGANTNSSGQCTMVFTSNSAGTVTGTATASLSLNGTSVTVSTDGSGDNSAPAVKTFVAGTIKWLKHDGAGQLLGGAEFTVCRTQVWDSDLNSGAGGYTDITPDVCGDVTDNVSGNNNTSAFPTDRDGTAGEFEIGGLILGKYTVTEKTAPPGYIIDPDTENVDLSTTTSSVTISTAFVNIQPPQLIITKVPDAADDEDPDGTVHPEGTAVFKVTVKNDVAAGGATATGVSMTDTLPGGLDWSDDKAECAEDQVTVNSVQRDRFICTIGDLDPQESFTVTFSATVPNSILQIPPSPAGTPLQIDGNLIDDGAGNDWATLPDDVFDCTSDPRIGCDIDRPTGRTDNSFGKGTKEDTQVPKVVNGSIPNNKSDLLRFYVSKERFESTDYLYLAWSRVQEPNGTTNMDFELNQSNVLSANGVTPVRTADDVLVRYDLSQGGTNPVLGFHRWITTGSPSLCEASNSLPCWDKRKDLTGQTDVEAAINSDAVDEPIAGGSLSARTFGEARINLQDSGIFEPGQCTVFGKAYLKSRSSDAFTSELKDFIAPIPINITNCAPVTLNNKAWAEADNFTPSGGNLGDSISDTGKIEVTEDTSASLNLDRTSVRLAQAAGGDQAMTGLVVALHALDANGRKPGLESPPRTAAAGNRPAPTLTMAGWLGARAGPASTSPLRRPRPGAISGVVT